MREEVDPVDRALASLRSTAWTGESHRNQLQEKLMRSVAVESSIARIGRRRLFCATGALFLLGALAFSAAGGVQWITSWWATTTIDGAVIDAREVTVPDGGTASFQVPAPNARQSTVTLERTGSADGGEATVSVTLDGTNANVIIEDGRQDEQN